MPPPLLVLVKSMMSELTSFPQNIHLRKRTGFQKIKRESLL